MGKFRRNRINEEMSKELSEILRTVKDPRVSSQFLTILRSDVTPDLKYAKIHYSVIGAAGDEEDRELRRGLKSAVPYIRGQLALRMNLRITPELTFVRDHSLEEGARIEELLLGETVQADLRRFEARAAEEAARMQETENQDIEDEYDD